MMRFFSLALLLAMGACQPRDEEHERQVLGRIAALEATAVRLTAPPPDMAQMAPPPGERIDKYTFRDIYEHEPGARQWCRQQPLYVGCPRVSNMLPAEKVAKPGKAEALCHDYVGASHCVVSVLWETVHYSWTPAIGQEQVIYRVDEVK
jgi:hypothetical protein